VFGSKNWGPASFNPQTGLVYANSLDLGMKYKPTRPKYRAGTVHWGADIEWVFPKDKTVGYLKAIEPLTGKSRWEVPSGPPRWGGVLSTAGGIVFTGQETGGDRPEPGGCYVQGRGL
jgi:alcohol dehydrogenase (cytochrome c)